MTEKQPDVTPKDLQENSDYPVHHAHPGVVKHPVNTGNFFQRLLKHIFGWKCCGKGAGKNGS